jgi:hypothetical protein
MNENKTTEQIYDSFEKYRITEDDKENENFKIILDDIVLKNDKGVK